MVERTAPEHHDAARPRVAVCALTFRRPQGLEALLAGIAALQPPPNADVEVVIVDNDPDGSGRTVVERWRSHLPWPPHYAVEPRRGIPFGRNRAVATAAGADFVAFLDDDEVPDPAWLVQLLDVHRRTGAAVVTGPVLPVFEEPPPAWATRGRFFKGGHRPTGQPMKWARTSNVLIAREVFPPGIPPFNEAMGLNGGDDTHFFMRALMHGHDIVWADDAVVTEAVPATRVRPSWLLRREYRRGNTLSLCLRDLQDSWPRRIRRAAQGAFRIAEGVVLTASGLTRGRAGVIRGLQRVCFGAGLLTGLAGLRYDEYRTTHGR